MKFTSPAGSACLNLNDDRVHTTNLFCTIIDNKAAEKPEAWNRKTRWVEREREERKMRK